MSTRKSPNTKLTKKQTTTRLGPDVTNPFLNPETVKLMRGVVKIPAGQRSEQALKVISDILKVTSRSPRLNP